MVTKKGSAPKVAPRSRPAWTVITFDELETYRTRHGLTKRRMAQLLEVTATTYHNWGRGIAVATPTTQARIRQLVDGGAPGKGSPQTDPTPGNGSSRPEVMSATAQIVEAYLKSNGQGLSEDGLLAVIREVREALVH